MPYDDIFPPFFSPDDVNAPFAGYSEEAETRLEHLGILDHVNADNDLTENAGEK